MYWQSKIIIYKKESRISVEFEKNLELNERIKKIEGCKWSQSLKCWHIPDTPENRIRFKIESGVQQKLNIEKDDKIEEFRRWLKSKRYSDNTIKTYCEALKTFLYYFKEKPVETINNQDIISFNNDYIILKKLSSSYQNQVVNAIKLFFKTIAGQQINVELIHRPKGEKTLPNVLSKEEVKLILESLQNTKHKAMLSLIYACGLRRGELLRIKPQDILSDRKLLHIKQSKSKKDRIVPLSDKLLEMLREYYKTYKPKVWLFEGQQAGEPYSEKSLESLIKQAVSKASINKPVTLHWLRHSYATHLLESGTDLRYIQELLGHNSSRTTEIYTHVSNKSIQQIKSPFDDL
jgi:integrase/recombinase XerD